MSKHRAPTTARRRVRTGARRAEPQLRRGGVAIAALTATATAAAITVPVISGTQPPRTASPSSASTSAPDAELLAETQPNPKDAASFDDSFRTAGTGLERRRSTEEKAPEPPPVPESGSGTFRVAAAPLRSQLGATTFRVEVEQDLVLDLGEVAAFVAETLADPRGWSTAHRMVRVDGEADIRIVLATPETTDLLCAPLDTDGRLSCRNGGNVVLNAWRWEHGADAYGDDITNYRRYLINHETGHALGYAHATCPSESNIAPVMLQQTKGLDGCKPNPWPAIVDLR